MKLIAILLSLLLLTACAASTVQSAASRMQQAEEKVEQAMEQVENRVEQAVEQIVARPMPDSPADMIAAEDAQRIALEHAGLPADRVTGLHTEYELDDGRPEYEVDFRDGMTQYEYTIHAETGEILSYRKDID